MCTEQSAYNAQREYLVIEKNTRILCHSRGSKNRFIFSTNGVIEPADRNDREATETIRVFNLQEDSLNSRRKQAMEYTRKLLEQMDKEAVIGYLQGEEVPSAIAYEISKS